VRRFLVLLAGGLGLRAFLRRRRIQPAGISSPAVDLRAKLDESKAAEREPEAESGDEDERRADVHARARTAIEELREPK
jgi:hypothetical protein